MAPAVVVPLHDQDGNLAGTLELWPGRSSGLGSVPGLVREASEYRYVVEIAAEQPVGVEPAELFDADVDGRRADLGRLTGRLKTQNYVGTLEVVIDLASGARALGVLEVHSTKLDYETQYRWMLAGVAGEGAELLQRTFGPTAVLLEANLAGDAETLYQQVAFLAAILRRPHTAEAFERVLRSPHVSFLDTAVEHPVGRGLPGSSAALRATLRAGPRVPVRSGLVVPSIPERVESGWPQATIDNPPNQLVRFVLEHWGAVLDQARDALSGDTAEARRGRREVGDLLELVDGVRTDRRLRDVGPLRQWPAGNQVVLRRPGYRDIHQAFLESRAAAMLRWDGADDLHRAGQRDVATLYEYWCYLELRRIVERLCHHFDSSPLVELSSNRMHLVLRQGAQQMVSGFLTRAGRSLTVELWFNRTFRSQDESWTLQMRPDCSLKLAAQAGSGPDIETWVHFDAKYRIESSGDLFVDDDGASRAARRADLLKMHAYRDAIRGSAGAYILFPGGDRKLLQQHYEILPGLGALPFVPGPDGHATRASAEPLRSFIEELIDHVAEQASNRERAEYWARRAHASPPQVRPHRYVPLERPPADTTVLLGYYRSPEHLAWIEERRLYNMRFGDRPGAVELTGAEAAAELLVLWSYGDAPVHMWWLNAGLELLDGDGLRARGYPTATRGRYLCRVLGEPLQGAPVASSRGVATLTSGRRFGQPTATTWDAIAPRLAPPTP